MTEPQFQLIWVSDGKPRAEAFSFPLVSVSSSASWHDLLLSLKTLCVSVNLAKHCDCFFTRSGIFTHLCLQNVAAAVRGLIVHLHFKVRLGKQKFYL